MVQGKALAAAGSSMEVEEADDVEKRLAAIDRSIASVQEKAKQSKKLMAQHCAELEQVTSYGRGDDARYEMVVYVGSFGRGAEDSSQSHVLLRKRLGRNEDRYRLENLTPQTSYFVVVRALHVSAEQQVSAELCQSVGDVDDDTQAPWGEWSEKTTFVTLKPITIKAHGVGSSSFSVEWDTGIESSSSSKKTAISKFQIKCLSVGSQKPAVPDIILSDSALKGHVVPDLEPSTQYSVSVRVCYEGDKWGVWSAPVQFVTLPQLVAKLDTTAERHMDFLVWRDSFPSVSDPQTLVWHPDATTHQLAINGVPCDDTFEIEEGTSTALTLDTLSLDTEYVISIRDEVDGTWQDFKPALVSETLPHVPQRPQLVERKGTQIAIAWEHRRLLEERQYLYMVEIALLAEPRKGRKSEVGTFQTLGFTTDTTFRLDLPYPIHACVFRVRAAKTNLTVDGSPMFVAGFVPGKPAPPVGPVAVDNPHLYRWSGLSPVVHFKTPSVPDHPTGIHVRNLTHNAAQVRWQRPANHAEHTKLVYRVYLNNSYVDRFTCVAETSDCHCQLDDLVPNTHYRVAVTAESTMGRSVNNNTLHFSTRGVPTAPDAIIVQRRPMASTLPPRPVLKPPAAFVERAAKERANQQATAEVGDVLIDDAGSTIYSAVGRRSPEGAPQENPRGATAPTVTVSSTRRRQLPPLPADARK
uniref:Fibronectin type-III domain-containing protein n=1 Tax=Neobodo designis TaxID=312471 RepID=A0A7S1W4S4_NEODS